MLHNIVVVGQSDLVDTLISKLRNEPNTRESCPPLDINTFSTLGYREFNFDQKDHQFKIIHLSTAKGKSEFIYKSLIEFHVNSANLCITCDTRPDTIDFLNLVNEHRIGFIAFSDDANIVEFFDEIKRKSSAQDVADLKIEPVQIALKQSVRSKFTSALSSIAAAAGNTATLFARQALKPTPKAPEVGSAITDLHL